MHPPVTPQTADFIHRLPKTETHLHIEGALSYITPGCVELQRIPVQLPFDITLRLQCHP